MSHDASNIDESLNCAVYSSYLSEVLKKKTNS